MDNSINQSEINIKEKIYKEVGSKLKTYVSRYTVPIYGVIDETTAELNGTGSLISIDNNMYLISASHVLMGCSQYRATAIYTGYGKHAYKLKHISHCRINTIDVCITRIDKDYFAESNKQAIDLKKFLYDSSNIDNDIVFLHGYPGEKSRYTRIFQGVHSTSLPYTTVTHNGAISYDWFNNDIHFAVAYPGEGQIDEREKEVKIPNPHGLSGSLIWAARTNKIKYDIWTPDDAIIIGIAHTWDGQNNALVCTRIEEIQDFLKTTIHKEKAYYHWLNRNKPYWDDLTDWYAVEKKIGDIFSL